MEIVSFNGNHFSKWKALLLVKINSFSGSRSLQWKPFLLVKTVPYNERPSF